LRLKCTYVDATIEYADKRTAALIVVGWRSEIRISLIDRWTAGQQRMRKRWPSVTLQRPKYRIGVDLIAWTIQNATPVITAEIITVQDDDGAIVDDVFSERAGVEDRVRDLTCS
jgi:hypothetical protein